ncbi:hypothetical protein BJX64DRAFT_289031 [Aspergillus heterothallicus]
MNPALGNITHVALPDIGLDPFEVEIPPLLPNRFLIVDAWDLDKGFFAELFNIHRQPGIVVDKYDEDKYFFEPVFRIGYEHSLFTSTAVHWTLERKDAMLMALHEEVQLTEQTTETASQRRQSTVHFILPQWLMNPAMLSRPYLPEGFDAASWNRIAAENLNAVFSRYGCPEFSVMNHTILPDAYLGRYRLVFCLQHPTAVFANMYRKCNGNRALSVEMMRPFCELYMTFRWMRLLYDSALSYGYSQTIIVLNHDSVIANLRETVSHVCHELGLENRAVVLEKLAPRIAAADRAKQELDASIRKTVIQQGLTYHDARIAEMMRGWTEEFGQAAAYMLADFSRAAIDDYEYLRQREMIYM